MNTRVGHTDRDDIDVYVGRRGDGQDIRTTRPGECWGKTGTRNAYAASMPMANQEARPLKSTKGSGGDAPNPALLGEPRSMRQSDLDEYQASGSEICPSCGGSYKRIGMHWSNGSCPYPQISTRLSEVFTGILMGDGYIGQPNKTPHLEIQMTNLAFLRSLNRELGVLSRGLRHQCSPEYSASRDRNSGFNKKAEAANYLDQYRVTVRSHPHFFELKEWYSSGSKRFPAQLRLTPTIAKYWYICDGCLARGSEAEDVRIWCCNESDRPDYLCELFGRQGFSPAFDKEEGFLRFGAAESRRLLKWMGDPPRGFEYKWGGQDE